MPIIISLKRLREGYVHGSTSNIGNVVIMMHGYLDLDVKFLSTSVLTVRHGEMGKAPNYDNVMLCFSIGSTTLIP